MRVKSIMTNQIGWQTVDNEVDEKTINGSLAHTLKSRRKIRRRTRALNIELKRFASLKSYKQYVNAKTAVLRDITDNEDTDEENNAYDRMNLSHDASSSPLPLPLMNDRPNGLCNLDSTRNADSTDFSPKQTKKSTHKNKIKNNLSMTPATRNLQDKQNSTIEKEGINAHSRMNLNEDASSSPSSPTINPSPTKLSTKCTKEMRKTKKIKYNLSITSGKRNIQEKKQESMIEKDTAHPKSLSDPLRKNDLAKENGLKNVTRNLTFVLENLDDTNRVDASQRISPIAHSTQIYNEDSNDDVYDNTGTSGTVNNGLPNTELQDSALCSDFHDDSKVDGSTNALVTNEMSDDGDVERDDKQTMSIDTVVKEVKEEMQDEQGKDDMEQEVEMKDDMEQEVEEKDDMEQEDEEKNGDMKQEKKVKKKETEKEEMSVEEDEEEEVKVEKKMKEDNKVEETEKQLVLEEILTKKSQPIITSTEIVKAKYTIVPDYGSTDLISADVDDCFALEDSQFSPEFELTIDEQVADQADELSPESKRVSQLKRINLITNSSDSEDSQDSEPEDVQVSAKKHVALSSSSRIDDSDESNAEKRDLRTLPPLSSQTISDPSDTDESIAEPKAAKHSSFTETRNEQAIEDKKSRKHTVISSASKSIKSQIREQENSSTALDKLEDKKNDDDVVNNSGKKTKKKKNRDKINGSKGGDQNSDNVNKDVNLGANDDPHKPESLQHVLKTMARCFDGSPEREIENSPTTRNGGEEGGHNSRPVELGEFIEREGLVASQALATMTAKDLKEFSLQNGDVQIWLMEIPKSIITDGNKLCGKKIAFEKGKMTINGTTYKTSYRDKKSLSCILRSGKKKSRFKTVNVDPVGRIVVRQKSSQFHATPPPVENDSTVQQFHSIVPFPKNLKSRNPLIGLNSPKKIKAFSTPKETRATHELKGKRKRKGSLNENNKSHGIRKKSI